VPSAALPTVDRATKKLSSLLVLVPLLLFLPIGLSFFIAGLRFTPIRMFCLIVAPYLVLRTIHKMTTHRYRFVFSDLLIVLAVFWFILGPANTDGISAALNHAGPDALEFLVAYLAPRVLLEGHGQARRFVDILCRAISIVALIGLLDPLTGGYITHQVAGGLTGYRADYLSGWEDAYRLGLLRATGPIEHPILYGFTCACGFLIALNVKIGWRAFVIVSCSLGLLFSFSSAAIQCAMLGVILSAYGHIAVNVPYRWAALVGLGAAGAILAGLISDSPLGFIISHLTFDPSSGYYRYWTWTRVLYYVSYSPWFGLGYGALPEEINHSIDSLWLVLSINAGEPAAFLVALTLMGAASISIGGKNPNLLPAETALARVLGILIFLTIFISFTVNLWGSAFMLAGIIAGVRANLGERSRMGLSPVRASSSWG